jgi:hypothetical protein
VAHAFLALQRARFRRGKHALLRTLGAVKRVLQMVLLCILGDCPTCGRKVSALSLQGWAPENAIHRDVRSREPPKRSSSTRWVATPRWLPRCAYRGDARHVLGVTWAPVDAPAPAEK